MLDIIKSMGFAIMMVPLVMVVILGLIYGLGEVFNFISSIGHSKEKRS